MVNTNKIRGRVVEQGMNLGVVASKMGIHLSTLSRKLNNESDMTLSEAESLQEILRISADDFNDYFFYKESCI